MRESGCESSSREDRSFGAKICARSSVHSGLWGKDPYIYMPDPSKYERSRIIVINKSLLRTCLRWTEIIFFHNASRPLGCCSLSVIVWVPYCGQMAAKIKK